MSLPSIPSVPNDPWLMIAYLTATYGNSPYLKIGAAVLGGFVFLLLFGMVRKHIFEVSMRGALFGFVAGILLMVILDLAIIFGMTDKTKVAKLNQEQNREAAIQEIIISGFTNLGNVLGVNTSISPKSAPKKQSKAEDVLNSYWQLPPSDSQKFKELLCPK